MADDRRGGEAEQGRSRSPRSRSLQTIIDVLHLPPDEAQHLRQVARPVSARPVPRAEPVGRLAFGVLGPLSVRRGENDLDLGNGRHRVVLARLALSANTTVSREQLIEVLWAEDPPATAVGLIHSYVSRPRRVLEPGESPRRRNNNLRYVNCALSPASTHCARPCKRA